MLGRLHRRRWLLGVSCAVGLVAAVALVHPWHASAPAGDVTVEHATLRPGEIDLVLVNGSRDTARVAQIILNDAFVDFSQSLHHVTPGAMDHINVAYPWVAGESYDMQLMTSTGATISYEIEDAQAGAQPS